MDVLARLLAAMNRQDADGVADCFAADYRSEQPVHPGRAFVGRAQVLANWTSVFEGVPDFRAELLGAGTGTGGLWAEQSWTGTHTDGSPFAMRGVMVMVIADDRIASARLYMEPVQDTEALEDPKAAERSEASASIDEAVRGLFRSPD